MDRDSHVRVHEARNSLLGRFPSPALLIAIVLQRIADKAFRLRIRDFHCTNQNALVIDPANCSTAPPTCRTIRILAFGAPQNSGPFACSPSTAIVNSGSASPWSTGIKRRWIWLVT